MHADFLVLHKELSNVKNWKNMLNCHRFTVYVYKSWQKQHMGGIILISSELVII